MNDQRGNDEQFVNKPVYVPTNEPSGKPVRHSGLGVASFILALVSIVAFIGVSIGLLILLAKQVDLGALFDGNGELTMTEEELADKIGPLLGYLFMYPFIIIINLIGLILGIIGLSKSGFKKVFAVIGTVLNGLALLAMVVLVIVAIAQRGL
ncbi:hypothetical protein D7Z26_12335 [Cohnella endophytica]|uniref:DUF4064 domain-containing protein n=1 Tax=Cohnella endophytica TaxID=2419778 RepID=A0A494XYP0_9BACL|nr:hypothetical protein [Cohnella endophytica]RKP54159.1 hypothetical protein D7Z26_12335 [Cohnella endophytica]